MHVSDRQVAAGVAVAVVAHLGLFLVAGWFARPSTPANDSLQGVMISLDDFDAGPPPTSLDDLPIENLTDNQTLAEAQAPATPGAEPATPTPATDISTPPSAATTIGPEPAISAPAPAIAEAPSPALPGTSSAAPSNADAAITAAVSVTPEHTQTDRAPSEQVMARNATIDSANNTAQENTALANGAYGDSQQVTNDYITHVRAWLARHKQYPQAARQAKAQGTVKLYLDIDSNGSVRGHRIVQSSGTPTLDQAAEDMLARSLPLPAMPSATGRNRLEIVIPIVFTLH